MQLKIEDYNIWLKCKERLKQQGWTRQSWGGEHVNGYCTAWFIKDGKEITVITHNEYIINEFIEYDG